MARIIDGNEMNMIGKNLRRLRIKKRLSQQALSDKPETMAIYVCRAPYPVLKTSSARLRILNSTALQKLSTCR